MKPSTISETFAQDFDFISKSFSLCNWPEPVDSDDDDEEKTDENSEENEREAEPKVAPVNRASTIKELLKKQEQLKSKENHVENRKRKKEKGKKAKNKKKKKISNDSENQSPPAKKEDDDCEVVSSSITADVKEDNKEKIQKITRAPIKYGANVVVNEKSSMLFSKLAFTDSVDELKPKFGGPKQPKHVLGKLEKMNSLISSLEDRGKKDKAMRLKENLSWSNAFFKAEGAKIKDNTNKVQKSVKQLEKRKRVSERKWKKRLEEIESKKEKKQRKREVHIQKRVDQKKERKLKKLIKRGRFIPELKTK